MERHGTVSGVPTPYRWDFDAVISGALGDVVYRVWRGFPVRGTCHLGPLQCRRLDVDIDDASTTKNR